MSSRATGGAELGPLEMQRVAVGAWPPAELDRLGEWVLRACGGFTSRANSALPVGDPGMAIPAAVDAVEGWYAARSLPAQVIVAGPVGFDVPSDPVAAEAIRRRYAASDPTLFLTATTAGLAREVGPPLAATGGAALAVSPELTAEWLAAYGSFRDSDLELARTILTGSPVQAFGTATAEGSVVGIGRLGVSEAWGGIAAMWVDPGYRRRRIAVAMLAALAGAAAHAGAERLHLQVWAHNAPALGLYRRFGFRPHHAYVTLTQQR